MVRSATYGHPVRVVREYAPGTLRGTYGEPVRAVRLVRPGARGERGQRITPVTYVPDGVTGLRDAQGSVIEAVSFYSQEGRTADGRVIRPVAYYSSTGLPLIEALFAGGTAGAAYLISPETCFTDTARTTPAQVGQAVAAVTDLSGRGNHLTQATAASRPILRQDSGGYYYLEFDGVDDFLRATFAISQPFDRISAIRQLSWTSLDLIYSGVTDNYGQLVQHSASPGISLHDGATLGPSNGAAIGVNAVVTERHNGTGSRIAVNNAAYLVGNTGVLLPGGLTIAANNLNTNTANIRLYSLLMIGRALSDAETVLARRMVAASCGKVL